MTLTAPSEASIHHFQPKSLQTHPVSSRVSKGLRNRYGTDHLRQIHMLQTEVDVTCYILRVPDQHGVSQARYIVEINHSGQKPLIFYLTQSRLTDAGPTTTFGYTLK